MKVKKALQAVSLVLPTLASMPTGAWDSGSAPHAGTGYSASYDKSLSKTVATFDRGGVTTETITYWNVGKTRAGCVFATISSGSGIVSYWQESEIWDEGCFSDGLSHIEEISDPNNNYATGRLFDMVCHP